MKGLESSWHIVKTPQGAKMTGTFNVLEPPWKCGNSSSSASTVPGTDSGAEQKRKLCPELSSPQGRTGSREQACC